MGLLSTAKFILGHPLNRGGRIAALGRFFRWQISSRLVQHPVALPFVNHFSLLVERGMTGATGNYYCGLHEADDMAFVLHFLRSGDAFYDVGANVGSYTLLAAAAGVKQITSFEPSPSTCERFERNISLNRLSDSVVLQRCALGNETGEVSFTKDSDTVNHVASANDDASRTELVPLRRFDDFYVSGKSSFIKIDVEGYEAFVLSGASKALQDPGLMGVLIEDNGSDQRYESKQSVLEILKSHGLEPCRYDAVSRELVAASGEMGLFGNILFLKNRGEAAQRVKTAGRFRLINGWI
ncbi:MAG: FkbM family methyltransferase [Arenimonas sp.]